jgi:hypothetical protein
MTSPGRNEALFEGLPSDVGGLCEIAQGLVVHEFLTQRYGFELADERRAMVHVRPVEEMLDRIVAEDSRGLAAAREPAARFVGDCRHFTVLTVAMLRARGTPARARCGFGDYFGSGMFEDHWVCEYWNQEAGRWVLADAQIDETQRRLFGVEFDTLNVPRDRFVVAGQAWAWCREGKADPANFGLSAVKESGDWWIAANLIRDVAALNNMEMLPWDVWGAMPEPDDRIDDENVALFDRLAALTRDPELSPSQLAEIYESDDRLRVPTTVFNAQLKRPEEILSQRSGALARLQDHVAGVPQFQGDHGLDRQRLAIQVQRLDPGFAGQAARPGAGVLGDHLPAQAVAVMLPVQRDRQLAGPAHRHAGITRFHRVPYRSLASGRVGSNSSTGYLPRRP